MLPAALVSIGKGKIMFKGKILGEYHSAGPFILILL